MSIVNILQTLWYGKFRNTKSIPTWDDKRQPKGILINTDSIDNIE
jgi:hypothetical protein